MTVHPGTGVPKETEVRPVKWEAHTTSLWATPSARSHLTQVPLQALHVVFGLVPCNPPARLPLHGPAPALAHLTQVPLQALHVVLSLGVARIVLAQRAHEDDGHQAGEEDDHHEGVEDGEPVDLQQQREGWD